MTRRLCIGRAASSDGALLVRGPQAERSWRVRAAMRHPTDRSPALPASAAAARCQSAAASCGGSGTPSAPSVSVRTSPARIGSLAQQPAQVAQVGGDPQQPRRVQRFAQSCKGGRSGGAVDDRSWRASGRNGHSPRRRRECRYRPAHRPATRHRRSGRWPAGSRPRRPRRRAATSMAWPRRPGATARDRLTGGDPQLVGDEVATGDHLRHRVLDLEPRVHLEEREARRRRRAGTRPCRRSRSRPTPPAATAAAPMPRAQRGVHRRPRRLLDDLLVAALRRAVALAEADRRVPWASNRTWISTCRACSR